MKTFVKVLFLLLLGQQAYAQHIYQIRADSVRIYNVCDTAELIIENRTRDVNGFLYNKNNGRTEFRRLRLESVGGSRIAISGQDTLDISTLPGIGGIDTIYRSGDNILYKKKDVLHTIYAPLPSFKEIPQGVSYTVGDYPASRITGFNAYSSPDMPSVSDQALTNPSSGNSYYTGHVVRSGSTGYQMAVNWDGELTGPKGVFIRNKDDTKTTWGAWRELVFKDYADGKYAAVSSLQTSGQAQVHWNNITNRPQSFPTTSDLQTVTDNGAITTNSLEINPSGAAFRALIIKRLVNGATASAQIANNNYTSLSWTPDISVPLTTYRVDIGTGTLKYYNAGSHVDIWRSDNHVAGSAFNPDLSGARVLQGIMSNASGHIVGMNTRVLTPGDIGAVALFRNAQDWNSFSGTTTSTFNENSGNAPTATTYFGLNVNGGIGNAYGAQLALRNNTYFFRTLENGTYGSWLQVADRSWVTSNFAASSGSGNYIQNQLSAVQSSSSFWISGEGRTFGFFRIRKDGSNSWSTSYLMTNSSDNRGVNFQLNGDTNPGLATWIHNGSTWVKRQEYFADGRVWFGGNVGIGENNPSAAKLVVRNDIAGEASIMINNQNTDNSSTAGINFFTANGTWKTQARRSTGYYISSPTVADVLSITNTGAVRTGSTLTAGSIPALGSTGTTFLTHTSGLLQSRTAAQVRADIGAAPSGGSGSYIQNQSATAQTTSTFWISGAGRSSGYMEVSKDGSNSLQNGFLHVNAARNRGFNIQLNGDANPGLAILIHNGNSWVKRLEVLSNGDITNTGNTSSISLNSGISLNFNRNGANYIRASNAAGYLNFVTGGSDQSEATAALTLAANNTATFRGDVRFDGSSHHVLLFNSVGVGSPTFSTRSAGTKLVLNPSLASSQADYGIGVESGFIWHSVPTESQGFKWYGGTTEVARMDGTGNFKARSLTSNNGTVNSYLTYAGSGNAGVVGTSTAHPFAIYTGGIERMRANTGGNILIGTTTDNSTDKLQVNGSVSAAGSMTATSFYQTSLRSLKTNIHPFVGSAIAILASAQVRTFQFKADNTGKTNIGFIADEVPDEIAIPERKGVDQASIVALLVKSVQELKQENERLRDDNAALQQRMKDFEASLEKLLHHQNK